jgi:hypothetical protein
MPLGPEQLEAVGAGPVGGRRVYRSFWNWLGTWSFMERIGSRKLIRPWSRKTSWGSCGNIGAFLFWLMDRKSKVMRFAHVALLRKATDLSFNKSDS